MDTLKKITGTWQGTFSYEPMAHLPTLEPVPFTLSLRQGWFGRFTGTVTDGGPRAMPGTGVVKGYFSYPRVTFTKRMPVCCVVGTDGRNLTLREYLIEQGHACQHEVPHPPISYTGRFSSPAHAQGTWSIKAGQVPLGDGRAVQMMAAHGAWSMASIPA